MEQNEQIEFNEAFDELAKSYEDPSRPEPSYDEYVSAFEDSSEENKNVSQNEEIETGTAEEPEQVKTEQTPQTDTPELPLDYKELYEKARRDAEAQNNLWAARLSDLSAKYNEVKKNTKTVEQKQEEPEQLPDNVKELFETYPDIATAVKAMVDQKVNAVKGHVENEMKSTVEPLQQHLIQTEADRHLTAIRTAHPDLHAIMDSGDLLNWMNTLPPVMQNGARYVYQYGSAPEVISLINDYKLARGVKTTAQPTAKEHLVATQNPTDDIVKQVLAALTVRTGKEAIDISTATKRKPKEKSFDDFAKEYELSRRVH